MTTTTAPTSATPTRVSNWVAARPPAPLPRTVAPIQGETVNSYLHRLARANHQHVDVMRRYLRHPTGTGTPGTISPDRLAAASHHPRDLLIQRLHGLGPPRNPAHSPPLHEPTIRRACRLCMARRTILTPVWCALPPDLVVCPRHQLWLGRDNSSHAHQHDLRTFPEILQSQRRHRRLLRRRYDHLALIEAQDYAEGGIDYIIRRALWTADQQRRVRTLAPTLWSELTIPDTRKLYAASNPTVIHIATYPELIDLTARFLTGRAVPYRRYATANTSPHHPPQVPASEAGKTPQ